MSNYAFVVGGSYTKSDIYQICNVPAAKQRGNWDTGYTRYEGNWFVFCNVGVAGRTGHDYANHFVDDDLVWYGKTKSHVGQDSIKSMVDPSADVYIFFRKSDRDPFTFAGKGTAVSVESVVPVKIVWSFQKSTDQFLDILADEVEDATIYVEGATKTISVNVYERNPNARKACIKKHGCTCSVCGFDFQKKYGAIGAGFIHVHHLKQLADIGTEYELDPEADLRPVCPNCHAMLHRRRPAFSIEELQSILRNPAAVG